MELRQLYEDVETTIADLRALGYAAEADRVETALRGGATSGEILGELSLALPVAASAVPSLASQLDALALWATEAANTCQSR